MPEGDTILTAARRLGRALAGHTITAYRSTVREAEATDVVGRTVVRVDAHGKNLLMHLDDGRALHSHMKMTGSWHVYRPREPWRKPAWQAKVVVETAELVAVCFNAPIVALLSSRKAARVVSELGPDILAEDFDPAQAVRRLRARGDLPLGEAIVHQGLLAGIGNIYKSETLFLCRADPFRAIDGVDDALLLRVVEQARALMSKNLEGRARRTRPGGGYWVYERSGEPCRECGAVVELRRQGDLGRSTYFCRACQGVVVGARTPPPPRA
jgi:endonuclease-8